MKQSLEEREVERQAEDRARELPLIPALPAEEVQTLLADEVKRQRECLEVVTDRYVTSKSLIWHKVLRGPPYFDIALWSTMCGWPFGRAANSGTKLESREPVASERKRLCQKCLPSERIMFKDAEKQSLREQVGEEA